MSDAAGTHFDCDARLRAITPPELTLGGIRYRGQLLSIVEWLPFFEQLEVLQDRQIRHAAAIAANRVLDEQQDGRPRTQVPPAPAMREWVTLYRGFLRAVFPWRLRSWLAPDPVKRLEQAPDPAMMSTAFAVFFQFQLRAMQGKSEPLEAEPSGDGSPTSASDTTSTIQTTEAGTSSLDKATDAPSELPPSSATG